MQDYYNEIYGAYLSTDGLKVKVPILSKYIIENTPNDMSPIDYAFHLKNEGTVIEYRDYLNQIELALESGNIKEFCYLIQKSDEAVSDVLKKYSRSNITLSLQLYPNPSIFVNYNFDFMRRLNGRNTISLDNFKRKKLQLTFIRDVAEDAKNRLPYFLDI